ncbi:protein phosphatase 2C domain-containing protein [Saccharothrix hoggarensis]
MFDRVFGRFFGTPGPVDGTHAVTPPRGVPPVGQQGVAHERDRGLDAGVGKTRSPWSAERPPQGGPLQSGPPPGGLPPAGLPQSGLSQSGLSQSGLPQSKPAPSTWPANVPSGRSRVEPYDQMAPPTDQFPHRSHPKGRQTTPLAVSPPEPPPALPPALPPAGPAKPTRDPVRDFTAADPALMVPPVLGGSPKAARLPWYLPVEPSQPGLAADEVRLGDLDVRAASVVGPDHRCTEPATARQDAYRLGRDAAGRHLVVAVADGMSAAARSDIGATVAVRAAVDLVRRQLDAGRHPEELDFVDLFTTVAKHVVGAATQLGCEPDEVLTALIVAVVPTGPTGPGGERRVRLASLADVSAWLRHGSRWVRQAGAEKHGLDRNALDAFLPHHARSVVVESADVPPGGVLAVLTDGVGDVISDSTAGARWFAERWRRPPNLASFLLDVNFEGPGQLDDRTAVVVWCGGRG